MPSAFPACLLIVLHQEDQRFDPAHPDILPPGRTEPGDPGAYTRLGVALGRHPELTRSLIDGWTLSDFAAFYQANYWPVSFGDLPPAAALVVFDCAVNQGLSEAKVLLQLALRVKPDGIIGPATVRAMQAVSDLAGFVEVLLSYRLHHYQTNPRWPGDGRGWQNRLNAIHAAASRWISTASV